MAKKSISKKTIKSKSTSGSKPKAKSKALPKTKPKTKAKAKPKLKAKPKAKAVVRAVKPKLAKASLTSAMLKLGEQIPEFSLPGTQGDFHLSEHRGRRVVLFFYPKDATPGCTLEGRDFSKLKKSFADLGVEVFGISRDSIRSHERYKDKEAFEFDLLSDEDETVCKIFDVIREKNMYGRKVMGIERSTFILDEEGRLWKEWRKVSVPGHAEEVLAAVKAG